MLSRKKLISLSVWGQSDPRRHQEPAKSHDVRPIHVEIEPSTGFSSHFRCIQLPMFFAAPVYIKSSEQCLRVEDIIKDLRAVPVIKVRKERDTTGFLTNREQLIQAQWYTAQWKHFRAIASHVRLSYASSCFKSKPNSVLTYARKQYTILFLPIAAY